MTTQPVSFDHTRKFLSSKRQPDYDYALAGLYMTRISATSAAILATYAPGELSRIGTQFAAIEGNTLPDYIEHAVYQVIPELFPVHADNLAESIINLEFGELPAIIPWPALFDYTQDAFFEGIDEPENSFGDSPLSSLCVFARYLDAGVDTEPFYKAAEHFGWPADEVIERLPMFYSGLAFDRKKFFRLLEKNGLEDYKILFLAIVGEIGNLFLDCTLDDVLEDYIPYTLENVRRLAAIWQEAQKPLKTLEYLAEQASEDPIIFVKIAWCWGKSFKQEKRPRTLMEVFRNERNRARTH